MRFARCLTDGPRKACGREVLDRFMAGLDADGLKFRGMLFPGLMLTKDGPKVLEFYCRFGESGDAGLRSPGCAAI